MKLSQKQAELLAGEIRQRLIDQNVNAIAPILRAKIEKFKEDRDVLIELKNKAEEAIDAHDKKLAAIIGKDKMGKIRKYWDADNIIEELEKANIPSLDAIEGKIILKAMFVSADEMDKFVNDLVKEFSKKKKVTS
jgi:hypothetical protein